MELKAAATERAQISPASWYVVAHSNKLSLARQCEHVVARRSQTEVSPG
jgi:hypothetical protein